MAGTLFDCLVTVAGVGCRGRAAEDERLDTSGTRSSVVDRSVHHPMRVAGRCWLRLIGPHIRRKTAVHHVSSRLTTFGLLTRAGAAVMGRPT
jgi:hypothetical protein